MSGNTPNVTPFQKRVFAATKRIPKGKVSTYGHIARAIGCGSPRAVGQALRRNPFAPVVPCHRVVRGDLTLGGFGGKTTGANIRKKLKMLADEGVRFKNGRCVDADRLHTFGK